MGFVRGEVRHGRAGGLEGLLVAVAGPGGVGARAGMRLARKPFVSSAESIRPGGNHAARLQPGLVAAPHTMVMPIDRMAVPTVVPHVHSIAVHVAVVVVHVAVIHSLASVAVVHALVVHTLVVSDRTPSVCPWAHLRRSWHSTDRAKRKRAGGQKSSRFHRSSPYARETSVGTLDEPLRCDVPALAGYAAKMALAA